MAVGSLGDTKDKPPPTESESYKRPRRDDGRRASPPGRGGCGPGDTREGLMSYKQFIQELEDDILPSEAERRYQEYKSEYITTQKRAYFSAHKQEDWLKDKYHPTNLLAVIDRRNEHAQKMSKDFLLELQSGTVDLGPGMNASSVGKAGHTTDTTSENEIDVGGKLERDARGSAKETDIPKAHPVSSEPKRVIVDVEQAQALVRKLDLEKGIEDNILCRTDNERTSKEKSHGVSSGPVIITRGSTSVKGLEGTELLDTLVTYLWRIHGLDYYGLVETNEAKGFRHVRVDGKNSDTSNGDEWENKIDSFWQERLNGQDPLEIMAAKEKIDAAASESIDTYVVLMYCAAKHDQKYGCGAKGCRKLFCAPEFVNKHLKLKHPELLLELTMKVREDLYFQNYMGDENAPGGIPVVQPTLLVRQACEMYQSIQSHAFPYRHCWTELRRPPKFASNQSKSKENKTSPNDESSPTPSSGSPVSVTLEIESDEMMERPIGRKASRRLKKLNLEGEEDEFKVLLTEMKETLTVTAQQRMEAFDKVIKMEEERHEWKRAREDRERQLYEASIMEKDTSTMEPNLAGYYNSLKANILKKMV